MKPLLSFGISHILCPKRVKQAELLRLEKCICIGLNQTESILYYVISYYKFINWNIV